HGSSIEYRNAILQRRLGVVFIGFARRKSMIRHCIRAVVVLCIFCISLRTGLSQIVNATLAATVSDGAGALIPGVEILASHIGTAAVSTTVTNESGTYRFAGLQPGPYQVKASLPGFQPQAFQITLGTGQQIRQNFSLQVGAVTQTVEVSVA